MKKAIVFSVGLLVVVGGLFLGNINKVEAQAVTSTKFSAGDIVRVIYPSFVVNRRPTMTSSAGTPDRREINDLGTVVEGPQYAEGYWWWKINYQGSGSSVMLRGGATGWSTENGLKKEAPSSKFLVGDWIEVTEGLSVYSRPAVDDAAKVGSLSKDSPGIIASGPSYADGYWMWEVNFGNLRGWVKELWIAKPLSGITVSNVDGPTAIKVGERGTWAITALATGGTALSYRASWGDGSPQYMEVWESSNALTHIFTSVGVYKVNFYAVKASATNGLFGRKEITVTVISDNQNQGSSSYKVGDWVSIKQATNLRGSPSLSGTVYAKADPEMIGPIKCQLTGGPRQADRYNWWTVKCPSPFWSNLTRWMTASLWMAEGPWWEKTSGPEASSPGTVSIAGPATLEVLEGGFWSIKTIDPNRGELKCEAKWGDGLTSGFWSYPDSFELAHYYALIGDYTMEVTCKDGFGTSSNVATQQIRVTESTTGVLSDGRTVGGDPPARPTITGPFNLLPSQEGQWSLSGAGGLFMVDWGDGAKESYTPNGQSKIVTHIYSAPGIYNIKFRAVSTSSGINTSITRGVGVLDPAMVARFAPGTKLRTKEAVMVMQMLGSSDPATGGSYSGPAPDFRPIPELGPKPKYAIGKVDGNSMVGPVTFWDGGWWVRVAFPGWKTGWVKESQLEEMCPPLSAAQLLSPARFAEGECVWVLGSLRSNLSVRSSAPVSGYPFYDDPSPIGTVRGGNQGVLISGPTATNDFVWWQASWDNGLQGWSAGNWIASERSKPKSLGGVFTPNSTTTIYFSPQGGHVLGGSEASNGPIVGRWWANTTGTIGWPEFVGGKWWYKVTYTPPSMPTLRGWSREEDLYGAGTPGNDVPVTVPTCEAKFILGDKAQVSPATFPAMAFSYSDPPGGNLGGDLSLDGRLGTVRNGPQRQNNICWWQVSYDYPSSRPTLWTNANYLQASGAVTNSTSSQGSATSTFTNLRAGESGSWQFKFSDTTAQSLTYVIRWGDGETTGPVTISGGSLDVIASHVYKVKGYYLIQLAVTNNKGESSLQLKVAVVN